MAFQIPVRTIQTVFTPLTLLLSTLVDLLPFRLRMGLLLVRDSFVSFLALIFGRALPPLSPPQFNLRNKVAIVTGSNSGIGLQIASDLARQGANVILACRSQSKARDAVNTITWRAPDSIGRVTTMTLDTSNLDSVKQFAETWLARPDGQKQIDIICHNAGIATAPQDTNLTPDGLEIVYATNVLGSFLLTHLLEPHLSPTARVVFTSSTGQYGGKISHDFAPGPVRGVIEPGLHCPKSRIPILGWERVRRDNVVRYSNTKTLQCALAKLLQYKWDRELQADLTSPATSTHKLGPATSVNSYDASERSVRGRVAHAFTPGFTMTPIFSKVSSSTWANEALWKILQATTALAIDVDQGAATGSWLASTNDEKVIGYGNGGGYWDRMTRRMCSADTYGEELLRKLWVRWENDCGVSWPLDGDEKKRI